MRARKRYAGLLTRPRPSRECPATPPNTQRAWLSPADRCYTYVPLARNDESIVTQYEAPTLEELGLLKMDFLALRNLTVLDDAEQHDPPAGAGV